MGWFGIERARSGEWDWRGEIWWGGGDFVSVIDEV